MLSAGWLPALLVMSSLALGQAPDPIISALSQAGLRQADLAFSLLPQERDSLRLARVDEILKEGRRLDRWADSLCLRLAAADRLGQLAALLQDELARSGKPAPVWRESPMPAGGTRTWKEWLEWLDGLSVRRLLEPDEAERLEHDLADLLQEDPDLGERTVFELDSLERQSEAEADRRRERLESALLPDPAALLALLAEADRLFLDLHFFAAAAAGERLHQHERFGPVLFAGERVAVGGREPNSWHGDLPAIIIDLGGDDRYEGQVAVSRGGVSMIIDLGGDDHYQATGEIGPAATVGGLALLLDLDGDDRYEGEFAALGAALGGMALLIDQAGDDHYAGDTFALGAGSLGIGALVDGGGHDLYLCSLYGEGFGHLGGLGLLMDLSGNDQYLMQARYLDQIRYEDHHLTLGQGFGFGMRPDLSGGIGLLHDLEGNDLYSADIYGQGAAYWWSLGALVDHAGNDRFLAWQYAQGAGVHLAAGILLDESGQDVYQSRGVSQGCGHDLALGWLLDRAGDDSYVAWDLSQGGGNANGCGLLSDLSGDDLYAMRGSDKPRAYGDPRRRTGSLGLFVDAGGQDHYLGGGANDSLWRGSMRGLGQDWSTTAGGAVTADRPAIAGEATAALDTLFREDDGIERLYVWAIRLEPKWSRERDLARAAIRARPGEFAGLVRERRLMASQISWERHALKELVAAMGQEALPLLEEAVALPVPAEPGAGRKARLAERGFALWTLSETPGLGDAALLEGWWSAGLTGEEPGHGALLLESLAERRGAAGPLFDGLRHAHAGMRRSAAWGLGRLPATEAGREALITALGDSVLVVRMSAFESLARDSLLSTARLERLLLDDRSPPAARREALRLLAGRDLAACRRLLGRLEADPVLQDDVDWIRPLLPPAPTAPPRRGR